MEQNVYHRLVVSPLMVNAYGVKDDYVTRLFLVYSSGLVKWLGLNYCRRPNKHYGTKTLSDGNNIICVRKVFEIPF